MNKPLPLVDLGKLCGVCLLELQIDVCLLSISSGYFWLVLAADWKFGFEAHPTTCPSTLTLSLIR
jgi:hypothetical protein